jgi:3-phenylpropionate/cinnamic acid dioxygenase small subunit
MSTRIDPTVSALVLDEARLIDQKRWAEWLALYTEDAVFWMPSWKDEAHTTDDPEFQLNLIYLPNRQGLEDRIYRIETGDSFASVPLDRTTHVVSGALVPGQTAAGIEAWTSWIVHTYGYRGTTTRSGSYEYLLRETPDGLRIARKKIVMIDDRLEGAVDVYHV